MKHLIESSKNVLEGRLGRGELIGQIEKSRFDSGYRVSVYYTGRNGKPEKLRYLSSTSYSKKDATKLASELADELAAKYTADASYALLKLQKRFGIKGIEHGGLNENEFKESSDKLDSVEDLMNHIERVSLEEAADPSIEEIEKTLETLAKFPVRRFGKEPVKAGMYDLRGKLGTALPKNDIVKKVVPGLKKAGWKIQDNTKKRGRLEVIAIKGKSEVSFMQVPSQKRTGSASVVITAPSDKHQFPN